MADPRVAIVTGAGGPLGAAVAEALVAAGMRVVGVDRNPEAMQTLSGDVLRESVDLTAVDDVSAMVDRIGDEVGEPAAVVNTVGAFRGGDAVDTTADALRLMMSVNLEAAWWLSQAAVRRMSGSGGGAIVHVAARQGLDASAGAAAYSVSKAALIHLVRVLATEVKQHNIRVNAVVPRLIDTPANRASFPADVMAHAVTPAAVADVIAYLVGDGAAIVSGGIVPVYGLG